MAVLEATAKLEEKRAEESSSRAALAETYARIRDLENKIAVGLSVKGDEVTSNFVTAVQFFFTRPHR